MSFTPSKRFQTDGEVLLPLVKGKQTYLSLLHCIIHSNLPINLFLTRISDKALPYAARAFIIIDVTCAKFHSTLVSNSEISY